jgi:ketosteroid isomerase-like protein
LGLFGGWKRHDGREGVSRIKRGAILVTVGSKLEILGRTIERGFPLGEDIPTVLEDEGRMAKLRAAIAEIATEDFVVEMVGDESFRRERRGVEGFVESWRDWAETFETFRIEIDDIVESGDHVVVFVWQIGRPRGADAEIVNDGAAVWTFKGERLARVGFYLNREAAREAAGVESGSPQSAQE